MHVSAAALLLEMVRGRTADVEAAVQVHLDHRIELVDAHLVEETVAQDACVVDHRVDAAEHVERGLHHAVGARDIRDTVGIGRGLATRSADLFDHTLRRSGVTALACYRRAEVIDDQLRALSRTLQCDVATDAAACASDEHYLAFEHIALSHFDYFLGWGCVVQDRDQRLPPSIVRAISSFITSLLPP